MSSRLEQPERPGYIAVVWRDGEVLRRDPWGRWREMPSIAPLPEAPAAAPAAKLAPVVPFKKEAA